MKPLRSKRACSKYKKLNRLNIIQLARRRQINFVPRMRSYVIALHTYYEHSTRRI